MLNLYHLYLSISMIICVSVVTWEIQDPKEKKGSLATKRCNKLPPGWMFTELFGGASQVKQC